jgi:putative restriction endonuclease
MDFYWVNLGRTYDDAIKHDFLWAPKTKTNKKTGKSYSHAGWTTVNDVKAGDIVFCYDHGYIKAVATAKQDSYRAKPPEFKSFESWPEPGYRIEVSFEVLDKPIDVSVFIEEFTDSYNEMCTPKVFNSAGKVTQNYMAYMPKAGALLILKALGDIAINISDSASSPSDKKPSKTTSNAVINARLGQGKFRKDILALWENTCPVTHIQVPSLLVASHIYPWQFSSNEERLDAYNGLPLSPTIDKLFDKGYVSFSDDGVLLINEKVKDGLLDRLGVNPDAKISGLTGMHARYLSKHRKLFGFEAEEKVDG